MRKNVPFACFVLVLLASSSIHPVIADGNLLSQGFHVSESAFGNAQFRKVNKDLQSSHTILFDNETPSNEMFASGMQELLSVLPTLKADPSLRTEDPEGCSNSYYKSDYFRFAPEFKAAPRPGETKEWHGACFQNAKASVSVKDETTIVVEVELSNAASRTCRDLYLIASPYRFHIEEDFFHGKHTIEFKNAKPEELVDLQLHGLRIFRFCNPALKTISSLLKTLKMFLGGFGKGDYPIIGKRVPAYMDKANKEFLAAAINWNLEERPVKVVDLEETEVFPGDFVAITRLDGIDPIIMWGTGSHIGHTAVVINFDGAPHVCESQDGWYWPTHGIQCNPWKLWVKQAAEADFHVAILPLKPEIRAKFDNEAAVRAYKEVGGLPYGYHNFLFGWIDTPRENLPAYLSPEIFGVLFPVIDKLLPQVMSIFFNEAINLRLGTKGLNTVELMAELDRRNIKLEEAIAMVEQDEWVYSDGHSLVCSVFATYIYKASGILGDINVMHTEFTPRDVYSLNIFDNSFNRAQKCADADPDLPYCQILGKYKLTLPGYSTIQPYSHMAEKCPSMGPDYFRPEGC
eukprot:GILI01003875.1.p2 GENE.GILI01003875.1~~GILI01003875.1.p2  ORF type:complete len:573 (+),score=211.74 GILI01003875.1:60-1778(+)